MVNGADLEAGARGFRDRRRRGSGPLAELAAEIALLSERLEQTRTRHAQQIESLAHDQSRIRLHLRRLDSVEPRRYSYHGIPRENLKKDLTRLRREQRSFEGLHAQEVAVLHDRLFTLLKQHELLDGGRDA